jgi:hypothetical protein
MAATVRMAVERARAQFIKPFPNPAPGAVKVEAQTESTYR